MDGMYTVYSSKEMVSVGNVTLDFDVLTFFDILICQYTRKYNEHVPTIFRTEMFLTEFMIFSPKTVIRSK